MFEYKLFHLRSVHVFVNIFHLRQSLEEPPAFSAMMSPSIAMDSALYKPIHIGLWLPISQLM